MKRKPQGRERHIPAPPGFYGCTDCETVKPVSEFHKVKRGPDGHSSNCKVCKQARRVALRDRMRGKPDPTIEARFWPKVDKGGPDDCWNWIGAKSNRGYGATMYQGRDVPAHRVSMILAGHDADWTKLVVDHLCKNIACVNPRHLRVTTQKINSTENSISPMAKNAQKQRCLNGHEYTPENTYYYLPKNLVVFGRKRDKPIPQRKCLACMKAKHPGTKKRAGPPI